jgi:hypothetical protein
MIQPALPVEVVGRLAGVVGIEAGDDVRDVQIRDAGAYTRPLASST